jgi:diguanylate cyclase (GGDEF)-like protein
VIALASEAEARLRAYSLMEAAQGEEHAEAGRALIALEEESLARGWTEAAFLASAGQALYAMVRAADPDVLSTGIAALVNRAEGLGAPALLALALALRALGAAATGDNARLLGDAGRAVALVDADDLPALDRCTVLVVCAGAYNTLSLWELVDELYDQAAALEPFCEQAIQAPAIAASRMIIRLEWATALLEQDDEAAALVQLRRAAEAVDTATTVPGLPRLWQLDIQACRAMLTLLLDDRAADERSADIDRQLAELAQFSSQLAALDDVEMLPLLNAMVALVLLRLGRSSQAQAAVEQMAAPGSTSSGARSFPAWVRARVLADLAPDDATKAYSEYGVFVSKLRWDARQAVLAAAQARISFERLRLENVRLARDASLDPLTGLQNRRSFDHWLTASLPYERRSALLLIDLDDFKEVNDLHGHAVGDDVLRMVARAIAHHVRAGDLAIRLGGDEFAVVLEERPSSRPDDSELLAGALERARALADAIAAVDWSQVAPGLRVEASIGVAVGRLGAYDVEGADTLYRQADAALYAAKGSDPA